jgi:hypothetical protein
MLTFIQLIEAKKSDACFHRYACSLLRQGMKQITITLDTPDIIALEKGGDRAAVTKVEKILMFIVTLSLSSTQHHSSCILL